MIRRLEPKEELALGVGPEEVGVNAPPVEVAPDDRRGLAKPGGEAVEVGEIYLLARRDPICASSALLPRMSWRQQKTRN